MNMGNAVRSQEFEAVHIAVASTWPGGVDAVVRMAAKPQMVSASAIHTPEPSTANKSSSSTSERLTTLTLALLAQRDRVLGGAEGRPAVADDSNEFVGERDGEDQSTERHGALWNP